LWLGVNFSLVSTTCSEKPPEPPLLKKHSVDLAFSCTPSLSKIPTHRFPEPSGRPSHRAQVAQSMTCHECTLYASRCAPARRQAITPSKRGPYAAITIRIAGMRHQHLFKNTARRAQALSNSVALRPSGTRDCRSTTCVDTLGSRMSISGPVRSAQSSLRIHDKIVHAAGRRGD
jgi:hypothetical protein